MTKYTFMVFYREYLDFLHKIKQIGVLHVAEKEEGVPENETLKELLSIQQRLKNQLKFLQKQKVEDYQPSKEKPSIERMDNLDDLIAKIEDTSNQLALVEKDYKTIHPWGNFKWETIECLAQKKAEINFYVCPKSKFNNSWKEEFNAIEINQVSSNLLFITVGEKMNEVEFVEPVHLPRIDLEKLEKKKTETLQKLQDEKELLKQFTSEHKQSFEQLLSDIQGKIDFNKVVLTADKEAEDKIMILEGWVPEDRMEIIDTQLENIGAWYEKSSPEKNDNVPVLLKNNRFTRLYEMVGSLYSLPAYKEIDLTPFFAPFFMLFFGFCLGDAGYGLLMMVATIILRKKAKPNMKPVWSLGLLFGISTLIMGIIGGTFFGVPLMEKQWTWLSGIQKIMLDQNQLMLFSIILGVIQIVFGLFLKAARTIKIDGFKYALSTFGWIIVLLGTGGSFALLKQEIVDITIAKPLMIVFGAIGGALVLFFNSPGKNLFLNFGLGLWDAYGTVTGLLGDVLSYIRLFALGLSSAVLGSVFNMLAFDLSGDIPVVSQLVTVLILLVGHSINFFMAALGSFVHPLRLTFVEFYKNTGFEGGGKKYTPFGSTK